MLLHPIRRLAGLIVATFTLALLPACGGDSERELIASAKTYLEKKDNKAAIIQLKAALQKNPESGEARFLLGDALLKSGDLVAAALELEKAHDLGYPDEAVLPPLAKAWTATGQAKKVTDLYSRVSLNDQIAASALKSTVAAAFAVQGLLERSEAATNAALQLDPKNTTARLLHARLLAGRGETDEALRFVDNLLADLPSDREANGLKGQLLWISKGDTEGAARAFRAALETDPRYVPAHGALITMRLQQRDLEGFKSQLSELQKSLPNHPETRFYETQFALMNKDLQRARDGAQQLLKAAPNNFRVLQLAGAVELQAGALLMAENHLTKALQASPNLSLARRLLAETYLRSGQPAKALNTLRPMLERSQTDSESLALAAEAHLQIGDSAKAEAYFAQAVKANPADPKARTALALAQIAKGNADDGIAQLEALAAKDPGTFADLALVSSRLRRGDLTGALKAIDHLQTKMPDKAMPHHLRGRILVERKDTVGARASFEQALVADPVYFPAVLSMASLDIADKKPELARKRFEDLLTREPKNYLALLAIAELRRQGGAAPSEIGALLAEAVRLNPTELAPRLALVDHHLSQRDTKSALSAANETVSVLPDNPQALDALGRAQLASGDMEQAISSLRKVAAMQPGSTNAHLRLAEAYVQNKDLASAGQSLRKALGVTPNLLPAQRGLIQLAVAEKRFDDAITIAREVQKHRSGEAVGYLLEGEIQASQKRWDSALALYRTALEKNRSTAVAIGLHALYAMAGRPAEADRFASTWMRERPKDVDFLFHLGSAAMSQRDFARAEAQYRSVLVLRPDDATALNNVSWLMVQQGKPGAVSVAERALSLQPDQPAVMDTLASALAADSQFPKAIEWQKKAVGRAPDNPTYRFGLAKLLIKSGDRGNAKIELETLAKLGDKFAGQAEVAALLKTL